MSKRADAAPPAEEARRSYSIHLATHAAVEYALFGTVTKTLSMEAPCPYCGALPPGMEFPKTTERLS